MTSFRYWVLAGALALMTPGCIIVDDDEDDTGALTVTWTIQGIDEPSDCAFFGFDRLELAVFDFFDDHVVTTYGYCEDFVVSLDLPEGFYSADATLLDSSNRAATTTQVIDDIDVYEGEELIIPIDFPSRSFR